MIRLVFCFLFLLGSPYFTWGDERPNILFIMTDDQGAWTTGFSGNKQAHTPNLDRLREQGVELANCFVTTPVCSPSRGVLMTGRYASELGIDDWIRPDAEVGLDPELPTWPRLLQQAGYKTGLVGKWHLGHLPKFHPTNLGYAEFMGLLRGGCPTADPTLEKDGKDEKFTGLTVDILTDHALDFLQRNREHPFALSLHYRAPHAAFLPVSDADWSHHEKTEIAIPAYPDLDTKKTTKNRREYYASITSIDRNIGRVMQLLEELNLAENTVVIFTSDHGYNIGQHGLMYKGNAFWMLNHKVVSTWDDIPDNRRPNMYETSLRVPCIIRWPGVITAGSTILRTIDNTDWFPTICGMANVAIPKQTLLRGENIVPLLQGKKVEWDETLYAEYNMRHGATTAMRVWRTPEWKLMVDFQHPGRVEFYDLSNDPYEERNLADSNLIGHIQQREKMRIELLEKMATTLSR